MKIPQHKIDEIASLTDIVDIISAYTPLRKAGRSFMGRCPFHEEKTPSFSVSQEKGVYHCFGCGKSGNVFTFVMDTENVSFFEAAKLLAEKANIKIEFEDEPYDEDRNLVDKIIEIHKRAARYFYDNLMGRDGEYAREYLRQRGTKEDMITKFGLGYSLRDKEALHKELSKEFTQEELRESGLFLVLAQNEFRDRFRGRLMFPIINEAGRVVGFGGRKLHESEGYDEAKYVNSPETKIYNKSRVLYGLNASKNRIKETGYAILVEGYMDLISLFQNGFENVVASSGTSLTGLQVKILSRYTQEVVVVFDADLAGQNASMRAIEMIIEFNMNVNVVVLPFGDDPDTFVRKNGPEAFERLLTKRQSIINYIGEQYKESGKMDSPEGKTEFVRRIINLIAKMRDAIKRDFYIKDIAARFSIYESIIRKELDNQLKLNRKGITKDYRPEIKSAKAEETEFAIEKVMLQERVLLYLLINGEKKVREFIRDNVELDFFQNEMIIRIVNRIMQLLETGETYNFNKLINSFDSLHITQILSNLEFDKELEFLGSLKGQDGLLKAAANAINDLKLEQYDRKINSLLKELEVRMNASTDYEEVSLQIKKTVAERDSLTHRRVSKD